MTYLTNTGFESGVEIELFDAQGTRSIQTTIKRTGAYAARTNPTTTATGFYGIRHGEGIVSVSLNAATLYSRIYCYIATLPAANSEELISIHTGTGYKFIVRVTSGGLLQAYAADGTTQLGSNGTTALSINTWYRIDVKVGTGASAAWEIRIGGLSELSGTANLGGTNAASLYVGKVTNRNGNSVDYYWDDVAIRDDDYPSDGAVKIMKPSADGNYTTWTIGAGAGDKWQQIDEVTHDSNTTYLLSTGTIGQAYTAALESTTTAGIAGPINGSRMMLIVARNSAGAAILTRIRSSSTDSDGISNTLGAAYAVISRLAATDPATGVAWTAGGLDGAEVGAVENATTTQSRLTAAYMMVDEGVPLAANAMGAVVRSPMWGTY